MRKGTPLKMRNETYPYIKHSETSVRFSDDHTKFHMGTSVTAIKMIRRPNENEGFVVSWMISGNGTYTEDGVTYPLSEGSVCIRRPDRDYRLELPAIRGVRLFLDLPDPMYRAMTLFLPELLTIPPVCVQPFHRELYSSFLDLYAMFAATSSTDLYTLFPHMVRLIGRITKISEAREQDPLIAARNLLDDVSSMLPLESVAEQIGMNYHTFRRTFASKYGMSPGKYRTQRRIEASCKLLLQGESVNDVAQAVGYSDIYTFTHRFTDEIGVSPTAYYEREVNF